MNTVPIFAINDNIVNQYHAETQTFQEENVFGAGIVLEARPLFCPSSTSSAILLSRSMQKWLTEDLTSTSL